MDSIIGSRTQRTRKVKDEAPLARVLLLRNDTETAHVKVIQEWRLIGTCDMAL